MAINLSVLAPITTAATALANLVLVTPQTTKGYQPQNPPNADGTPSTAQQPPSLLFHYEGEQTAVLESDITDHFIEDNTAIQDQIALRPEVITTHGFIGELNDISPKALALLQQAAEKLTVIDAYTPVLSATALIAYNEAVLLYETASNVVNAAVSAWSSITGNGSSGENVIGSGGLQSGAFSAANGTISNSQNKQQQMFQLLYGYWRSRTLFTVQTPWAVFQNMAIKSLRAIQDAETNVISDFEVQFKMMRFANTSVALGVSPILSGRAATQASSLTDLGTNIPQTSSTSFGTLLGGF